ncbi:hypothetical protein ACWPM1_13540 [Tsuneonella sp. HG249]
MQEHMDVVADFGTCFAHPDESNRLPMTARRVSQKFQEPSDGRDGVGGTRFSQV